MQNTKAEDVTKAWPDHFDDAIRQLNERIIPALQFSPKELLLGLIVNTTRTPSLATMTMPSQTEMEVHLAYANQQRLDATDRTVLHAVK